MLELLNSLIGLVFGCYLSILNVALSQGLVSVSWAEPVILSVQNQIVSDSLIVSVNSGREKRGLAGLQESPVLSKCAEERATYLFKNNQWSHDGFRDQFLACTHLSYGEFGENLAKSFVQEEKIVPAWELSKSHAENLFNPGYKYAGVGRYENYVVLWLSNREN